MTEPLTPASDHVIALMRTALQQYDEGVLHNCDAVLAVRAAIIFATEALFAEHRAVEAYYTARAVDLGIGPKS